MLLPTDLSPETLGLEWRMPPNASRFPDIRRYEDGIYSASFSHNSGNEELKVSLQFDDAGLGCISKIAQVSKWLWECEEGEIDAVFEEYIQMFEQVLQATCDILGPPDLLFDGTERQENSLFLHDGNGIIYTDNGLTYDILSDDMQLNPTYTKWMGGTDYPIAFWIRNDARYQVSVGHEDNECPVVIMLSAMRPEK